MEIRALLKAARYPEARFAATQLLKKHGEDDELFYLRGTACAHRAAHEQAEKDLRAAIALKPKCIEYYLTLSNILFGQGKYELAFHEFVRARLIAPNHPKLLAYSEVFAGPGGKLQKAQQKIEAAYVLNKTSRGVVDSLVGLYIVNALVNWNVRVNRGKMMFFAVSPAQIDEATVYLDKLRSMPVLSDVSKQKRNKLQKLVTISRQKHFDGFASDWVMACIVFFLGLLIGAMVSIWYALSALAATIAYLRPNYLNNRPARKYGKTIKGRVQRAIDFCYGEANPSLPYIDSLYEFLRIDDAEQRVFAKKILRSLIRAALLPFSVFAAFYRNYSIIHAVIFSSASLGLAVLFSL